MQLFSHLTGQRASTLVPPPDPSSMESEHRRLRVAVTEETAEPPTRPKMIAAAADGAYGNT